MSDSENILKMDLNPIKAQQMLRDIATHSERVFFTAHAEKRMTQRHITRTQMM